MERLSRHLADEGILYVEVPMEIWGRALLQEVPVTHVFTRASLRYMLARVGLREVRARLGAYLHPTGRHFLAIRAIAKRGMDVAVTKPPGCDETERLLSLGLRETLWRYALTPANVRDAIQYKMRRRFTTRH